MFGKKIPVVNRGGGGGMPAGPRCHYNGVIMCREQCPGPFQGLWFIPYRSILADLSTFSLIIGRSGSIDVHSDHFGCIKN